MKRRTHIASSGDEEELPSTSNKRIKPSRDSTQGEGASEAALFSDDEYDVTADDEEPPEENTSSPISPKSDSKVCRVTTTTRKTATRRRAKKKANRSDEEAEVPPEASEWNRLFGDGQDESEEEDARSFDSPDDQDDAPVEDTEARKDEAWRDLVFQVVRRSKPGKSGAPTLKEKEQSTVASAGIWDNIEKNEKANDEAFDEDDDKEAADWEEVLEEHQHEEQQQYIERQKDRLKILQKMQESRRELATRLKEERDKQTLLSSLRFLCPQYALWTEVDSSSIDEDDTYAKLAPRVALPLDIQRDFFRPNHPIRPPESQQRVALKVKTSWSHRTTAARKWALLEGLLCLPEAQPTSKRAKLLHVAQLRWLGSECPTSSQSSCFPLDQDEALRRLRVTFSDLMSRLDAISEPSAAEIQESKDFVSRFSAFTKWIEPEHPRRHKRSHQPSQSNSAAEDNAVGASVPLTETLNIPNSQHCSAKASCKRDLTFSSKVSTDDVFSTKGFQQSDGAPPLQESLDSDSSSSTTLIDPKDSSTASSGPSLSVVEALSLETTEASLKPEQTSTESLDVTCADHVLRGPQPPSFNNVPLPVNPPKKLMAREDTAAIIRLKNLPGVTLVGRRGSSQKTMNQFLKFPRKQSDHPTGIVTVVDSTDATSRTNESSEKMSSTTPDQGPLHELVDVSFSVTCDPQGNPSAPPPMMNVVFPTEEAVSNGLEENNAQMVSDVVEDSVPLQAEITQNENKDYNKSRSAEKPAAKEANTVADPAWDFLQYRQTMANEAVVMKAVKNPLIDAAAEEGSDTSSESESELELAHRKHVVTNSRKDDRHRKKRPVSSDEEADDDEDVDEEEQRELYETLIAPSAGPEEHGWDPELRSLHQKFMETRDEEFYKRNFTLRGVMEKRGETNEASHLTRRQAQRHDEADADDAAALDEAAEIEALLNELRHRRQRQSSSSETEESSASLTDEDSEHEDNNAASDVPQFGGGRSLGSGKKPMRRSSHSKMKVILGRESLHQTTSKAIHPSHASRPTTSALSRKDAGSSHPRHPAFRIQTAQRAADAEALRATSFLRPLKPSPTQQALPMSQILQLERRDLSKQNDVKGAMTVGFLDQLRQQTSN